MLVVNAVNGAATSRTEIAVASVFGSTATTGVSTKSAVRLMPGSPSWKPIGSFKWSGSVLNENALTSPGVQSGASEPSAGAPPGGAQTSMPCLSTTAESNVSPHVALVGSAADVRSTMAGPMPSNLSGLAGTC